MFAARDQENLVHTHHQAAAAKPLNQTTRGLQPKTPGNKFPKTPLKLPLNDENALGGFGGKSGKGKGLEGLATTKKNSTFDKDAFVTPLGPRVRAPLGMKTTNAKAKVLQTPTGPVLEKEFEKTQAPKTGTRRPKKVTLGDTVRIQVHGDESPLRERDVEYAPPKSKDLPYESEDFPRNCLNYDPLKPENLKRGIFTTYHAEVDSEGLTKMDRDHQAGYEKAARECDAKVRAMMEEDWTIGDVPETFTSMPKARKPITARPVGTVISRKAAVALSAPKPSIPTKCVMPKPKTTTSFLTRSKPTVIPTAAPSTMRHSSAVAASKSTIGYTKGRSASNILQNRERHMGRSVSSISQKSDTTITPARFAEQGSEQWNRLKFLNAFDPNEEVEAGLRGGLPECLRRGDEDEEEFVMTLPHNL